MQHPKMKPNKPWKDRKKKQIAEGKRFDAEIEIDNEKEIARWVRQETCTHQQLTDPILTQTQCYHLELTSQTKKDDKCRHCGRRIERLEAKIDD